MAVRYAARWGTRFTSPALIGYAPVWSPDGRLIAFSSGTGLYVKDPSGGLEGKLLLENGNSERPADWSRDGRYFIYTEIDSKNQGDIWFLEDPLNKSGERKAVKFQGRTPWKARARSRRTATGSRMLPTNPVNMRCTFVRFLPDRAGGRSRPEGSAESRAGGATVRNCSFWRGWKEAPPGVG